MRRILPLSTLGIFVLSACTSLSDMPTGTSLIDLEQKFGAPSISCPAENPNRFVWSMQPMGQKAWGVDINAQQQLTEVAQVLTDQHFALLSKDTWDKNQVLCYFGPPAQKMTLPYYGVNKQVWAYRYKQYNSWDSMMYLYFNDAGVVEHYSSGPDPLTLQDGIFFR